MVDFENDLVFNLQCLQKRSARKRFRRSILEKWPECGYCGRPKPSTLDHVHPQSKGGKTVRKNLIGACADCNLVKSDIPWFEWYRAQDFWTIEREERILDWVNQSDPKPPSLLFIEESPPGALMLPQAA